MKTLIFSLTVSLTVSLTAAAAFAGEWSEFRGPGGLGSSDETGLPATWSETENVVWKTEMPGYGSSSPITLGDRIYVTCYSGYGTGGGGDINDLRLHVVAVNRANGKVVWDESITPKSGESSRVRDHGYSAPTPTTDGKNLYVFFGLSGVFAFDLEGNQLWNADVGSKTSGWGCGTSPRLYKDLVIVNASVESGSLVAVNKKTGKEVWRAQGMQRSWNTPLLVDVGDKQELVVSVRGSILGFDPATGKQLWSCRGIQDYVCPSVVAKDGIVYAVGGRSARAIAVRAGGRGDVTASHQLWEARVGANVSSPVIYGNHLYGVSERRNYAYCLELKSGDIVYQESVKASPYASAVAADGKLFFVSRQGGTLVLAAKPKFEEIATNRFEGRSTFNASPAISNGRLYLRSNRYLYCIGKEG